MSSIYHHTRSPRLKEKIQRLLDVSPDAYVAPDFDILLIPSHVSSALKSSVTARLWKLSQRVLFDRTAARSLKPLSSAKNPFEQSLESQVILDEGESTCHGRHHIDQAIETWDMLDEGYCSQEATRILPGADDDFLLEQDVIAHQAELQESESDDLFEDGKFASGESLWERRKNLLRRDGEVEFEDDLFTNDLWWDEEEVIQRYASDEDLTSGEENHRDLEDEALDGAETLSREATSCGEEMLLLG